MKVWHYFVGFAGLLGFSLMPAISYQIDSYNGPVLGRESVGTTLDAKAVPVAFNNAPRTLIETTGGAFLVMGSASVLKGRRAEVVYRASQLWRTPRYFLVVDGQPSGYRILKY